MTEPARVALATEGKIPNFKTLGLLDHFSYGLVHECKYYTYNKL